MTFLSDASIGSEFFSPLIFLDAPVDVRSSKIEIKIVPRDQVFPFFSVYSLLLLHKNKWFCASFNHKNCSGLFLSAYFLL